MIQTQTKKEIIEWQEKELSNTHPNEGTSKEVRLNGQWKRLFLLDAAVERQDSHPNRKKRNSLPALLTH